MDAGTSEALRVIVEVLRASEAEGRVEIEVRPSDGANRSIVDLVPANVRACPVSVLADAPPQVQLFLGSEPTIATLEIWSDDLQLNLARLRELLTAVVEGRYEQTIETRKRDRIRVEGRFQLPTGEESHEHATRASASVKPGDTYVLRFQPY